MKSSPTILLLCLTLILFSCVPIPEEDRVTHNIIRSSFERIKHEFPDVKLIGTGGGVSDEGIRLIIIELATIGKMDRKLARLTIIRMVELLLDEINSNENHQSYLAKSPFTSEDITLGLLIRTGDNRTILHPDIFSVSIEKGKVFYFTHDESSPGVKSSHIETYEEALKEAKDSFYRLKKK